MRWVQFRLATLFWLTAVAAIVLFGWLRLVRPNVSHITLNSYGVVIQFSDSWHRWMGLDYWDDETGLIVHNEGSPVGGILLHDFFIRLPWPVIVATSLTTILGPVALYLTFRQLRRWRTLADDAH